MIPRRVSHFDFNLIINHLKAELDRFSAALSSEPPHSFGEYKTAAELVEALEAAEELNSSILLNACTHYAMHGRVPVELTPEQLWLLQFRFQSAWALCSAFLVGIPPHVSNLDLLNPELKEGDFIAWLLVSAWTLYGQDVWLSRQELQWWENQT